MSTKEIGAAGERLVHDELAARGYAIIDTNIRIGSVEVDILARHANRIVVIEVKTRKEEHLDDNFGIDRAKLLRLCRAGASYVQTRNLPHEVQIDAALVVTHAETPPTLTYLKDIALPPMRRRR